MEFTLKYRGPLPGGNASGKVEYKHAIRKALHEQLADLWTRDPRLNGLNTDEFHVAQKSERFTYDVPRPIQGTQNFFFRVPCGGIDFIPLVIRLRYLECQLVIDWHRHDPPGTILSPNGDVDNRLKTLFDAMRIPQNASELPAGETHTGPFFCLLEDDSLITKLSVDTSQILGSAMFGANDVELTIHVTVRPRYPMIGNNEMLFP
jgi:hypothetical protein